MVEYAVGSHTWPLVEEVSSMPTACPIRGPATAIVGHFEQSTAEMRSQLPRLHHGMKTQLSKLGWPNSLLEPHDRGDRRSLRVAGLRVLLKRTLGQRFARGAEERGPQVHPDFLPKSGEAAHR